MADQISGRPQDHRVRIKILKGVFAPEPPGKQNRKGDFVQLDPSPVGLAVNPEVLGETSVLVLRDS